MAESVPLPGTDTSIDIDSGLGSVVSTLAVVTVGFVLVFGIFVAARSIFNGIMTELGRANGNQTSGFL